MPYKCGLGSSENVKERDHLEKLVMDSMKRALQMWDGKVWARLVWLTIETSVKI